MVFVVNIELNMADGYHLLKIVSGGQTGVDRGALDGALEAGIDIGGWCPKGRLAEDGVIPLKYPLIEHKSAQYIDRTRQNVIDSDGTLIIYFSKLSGGTLCTHKFCVALDKAYLLLDADKVNVGQAFDSILDFLSNNKIETLNVAGPRASNHPKAYSYAKSIISQL